jgi:hypothetical protein
VPLLKVLLGGGRHVRLRVSGHSMTPFIRRGDLVTVRPRCDLRPSLGDVLVVAADSRWLTVHRHVGWAEGRIVPRGDSATAPDTAIPLASVLGVVIRVDRQGRRAWAALGPERRMVAWLSRIGLLGQIARLRARLKRSARGNLSPTVVSGPPRT